MHAHATLLLLLLGPMLPAYMQLGHHHGWRDHRPREARVAGLWKCVKTWQCLPISTLQPGGKRFLYDYWMTRLAAFRSDSLAAGRALASALRRGAHLGDRFTAGSRVVGMAGRAWTVLALYRRPDPELACTCFAVWATLPRQWSTSCDQGGWHLQVNVRQTFCQVSSPFMFPVVLKPAEFVVSLYLMYLCTSVRLMLCVQERAEKTVVQNALGQLPTGTDAHDHTSDSSCDV
jgi:hypothetical protein